MKDLKILILDDIRDDAELVAMQLEHHRIQFSWKYVDNKKRLKDALKDEDWDAVISDYSMPGFNGIEALGIVKKWDKNMPFIMVSGTIGEDVAVEAMKKGVQDYMMKRNMVRLGPALLREIEDAKIRRQREKAEQDLKEALKKAEESDRLKSAFLSTMSHELRTPLNAILGFSEIISEDMQKDEIIEFVKLINKSGHLLFEIIEDILDVTDIESGKSRVTKEEFNINTVLQDMDSALESMLAKEKKQHLKIKYHSPADSNDLTLVSNISKFSKILILLLKNAVKFTDEGCIEYGFKPEKDKMVFYVKDTGIGISEDERDIVFEKFRQVDDSHTRKYGGVGLGLTLVKKLTELLDGSVWFDSEPGKGSVFYFSLPYEAEKKELPVEKKIGEKKVKKFLSDKTILIVEDENSNYLLLEKLLSLENANTIWAKNGEESIEKFKENENIDLILMDLKMPVMNGYEATRQIKQLSKNLPIIALTAYTESESIEKALSKGFDDYLEKPIKRTELFERIGVFMK